MYLLDTNAWIAYLNPGESPVVGKMRNQSAEDLYLCSVVKAELFYGAYRSPRSGDNLRLLAAIFSLFPALPFDDKAADHYGQIRAYLDGAGKPIGPNDIMIAAIGRANNLTVITHNIKEFSRVPGLKIEDWQAEN